jgi:flagellar biosynthesis chaperone FliJ
MSKRWIPVVLRARQAQEDLAAQQLAVARRDAAAAANRRDAVAERVESMTQPGRQDVLAFQATAASLHAAAATLAAAHHRVRFAEGRVDTDVAGLTTAARARRTIEKLHESEAATRLALQAAAGQRDLDEVSITRYGAARRAAR